MPIDRRALVAFAGTSLAMATFMPPKSLARAASVSWKETWPARRPGWFEKLRSFDEIGDGWSSLVEDFLECIEAILVETSPEVGFEIHIIKEKFGMLRIQFSLHNATPEAEARLRQCVSRSWAISGHICEVCGEVGRLGSSDQSGISCRCAHCTPEGWAILQEDHWLNRSVEEAVQRESPEAWIESHDAASSLAPA